jgi:hypothetical protein
MPSPNTFSEYLSCFPQGIFLGEEMKGSIWRWVTPRIIAPTLRLKGKGFKSNLLSPAERAKDGVKS